MAYSMQSVTLTGATSATNFTLPDNCGDTLLVTCAGAGGPQVGDGTGGYVQSSMAVLNSWRGIAQFICRVGGVGKAPVGTAGGLGGFSGGGAGGANTGGGRPGYGGSGASEIRFDGTATPADTLANRRMVAGGAGAGGTISVNSAGAKGAGGQGGAATGANGTAGGGTNAGGGGKGGTQSAGGAAGGSDGITGPGNPGSTGQGGNGSASGSTTVAGGGGGGGGYFGGGAGGNGDTNTGGGGGGAGGSNLLEFTYFGSGVSTQGGGGARGSNGSIQFQWYPTPQVPLMRLPTAQDPEALIQRPYTNLALNPGMEAAMDWSVYNSSVTSVVTSTTKKKSGSQAGRISWKLNIAATAGRISLPLSGLAIGQRYGVSLKVLNDNVSGVPVVKLHILGMPPTVEVATLTTHRDGTTWDTITLYFVATASSHTLQLINTVAIPNTASSSRFTYFDELLLQALDTDDEQVTTWFSGSSANSSWTGTANNSTSIQAAIINPDYPFTLNWSYVADTTNTAYHWKSEFYYTRYNTATSLWEGPFFLPGGGAAALKTAKDGSKLSATIAAQPGIFLSGQKYRLYIHDMNVVTNAYGPAAFLEFSVPVRPTKPTITTPALTYSDPPTNSVVAFPTIPQLPMRVTWTLTQAQERWRIRLLAYGDAATANGSALPVWESGWQRGSAPAGSSYSTLINPSARGARFILYLETHNGTIASTSELTAFYIPPSPDILEGLVSRQNLELEVYDGITGDFIDVVTEATGIQYLDELRGPGGGSFDIRLDDPSWTRSPTLINPRNVVRVKDHGAYIGFWVITGHEPKVVQAGEAAAEGITVKGVGGYGIWPGDALLFPRTGKADFSSHLNLIPNQRSFGVASHVEDGSWYDVTTWNNATQECRQDNVIDPSIGNGNPWRGSPSSWPSDLTTAYWMWSADYRDYALPGTLVFKQAFNNLETVPIGCQFFIAADDEAQVYLDGAPWVTATDWHDTTQSEVVFVSPGYHEVTIIAAVGTYDNSVINYWKNPAGILCGMYVLGTGNAAAAHNVYLKSGSSWLVTGYGPLPTMTIGDILTQLYNEAADRGVTSFNNFDIGFDDVNDSYGLPWSKDGTQWLFDVFTQYDQIFDKLTDTACEIWFDGQLRLQASRQRGANRALTAPINTYFEIVQNAGPSVFYDFQEAMVTVSIPSAGITTKGFPTVTGSSVGFPLVNGASQTALGYKTIINDSPGSLLQEPATEIHGVVTDSTYLSTNGGQDIFFYGADWMSGDPGADVLMHLSSQDGMTFEWLQSDSIFSMDFRLFSGDDAPTWATVGASAVHVFNVACTDDNPNHFNQAKIVLSDGGQPGDPDVFVVAWVLMDNLTHHWAVNYFNQGQDGYIVVYRDGIELLTASYPINFVAGGLVVTYHVSKGPSYNQKLSPGLGAVALYDRVLTEDEIYDHYLAIQNVVYGSLTNTLGGQGISRIEPVIFRKAKNVVNSSATIDHAAKTSLIARTLEGATQIDATLSARNRVGRIEGYYDGSSKRTQDARRVASQAMTASLIAQTSNTLDITGDYVPWRDFGVGDWVLAPGDYNEELIKRRVVSISVSQDPDTGRSVYALEVDSLNNENAQRVALWLNRTLPQGSLSGLIADSG